MFEYIVEPENKKKVLDDTAAEELAAKIVKDYDTYDTARQTNLDKANALQSEIFFKNSAAKKDKEVGSTGSSAEPFNDWKSNAKLGKAFMFYQTLKAFIWKNIYANINSMFDVSGENQETDNESNKQKAYLTDILEKMDFQQTCDKIIDYALIYGEISAFAAWKKKYEEYRRPIEYFQAVFKEDVTKLPLILEAMAQGKNSYIDRKKVYDNPYVYPVNPANLVFDVAQKDNWDNCPKIYRTFKTPDEIINNKFYHISKEDIEEIKNLTSISGPELSDQSDKGLSKECINGNTVEVLDHWGDIKVDGELLKNWHAVVVARKFLVLFEKNNRIINPFTYGTLIEDPETKRGISPIFSILDLAHMQEDLFNRTCDMQALAENPPIFAPEDFFKDKDVKLYPGKIIAYGDSLNPDRIKPMDFNVSVFLNDISYLNDLMAETSGIFPNMAGAEEQRAKTATEISTKAQGQVTRLAMIIDTINQYLIIPVVEKVAKLCADFKSGEEQVYINKDNKQDTITIDDNVRQGDYKYTYSDRTLTAERVEKADMVVQAAKEFAQFVPLNTEEIFLWYFEQKGVENPERFLQQGVQLPQEIQNYLGQQPEVQALMAGYEQRQQEAQKGQQPQQDLIQEPQPPME